MLNTASVSLIMADMQGMFIETLEEDGFSSPSLYLLNEESPIRIDSILSKYESILDVAYTEKQYGAYITRILFRNRDTNDDIALAAAIKEIAKLYQPDAIGYISQCLYKTMSKEEYKDFTVDKLNLDPDTFRVLHNCFFIKGGAPSGYLMVTPYKIQKSTPNDFDFEESNAHAVLVANKGWESASAYLETRIQNPYL